MKHSDISLHTKRALADALKRAMKQKPFQKITVSELVRACDVNRKTFYYHFDDIYMLLKWMFEQETLEVVKRFNLLTDYEAVITFVMDYVDENDYIINCVYDAIGRDELKRFFVSDMTAVVTGMIEQMAAAQERSLDAAHRDFVSRFFVEAIAGVLVDWIKDRTHRNRTAVQAYISHTVYYALTGILSAEPPSG